MQAGRQKSPPSRCKSTGVGCINDGEKRLRLDEIEPSSCEHQTPVFDHGCGHIWTAYNEKGMEGNPNHMGVSFEDETKIIDIRYNEFIKPNLCTLIYPAPSNNPAAAVVFAIPGILEQSIWDLKVG